LAVSDYLRAGKLNPAYAENFNNLAFLYSETGRMDEALEYYSKAISILPSEYLFKRRATCYITQKKYSEALQDYLSALNINPESGETYFNCGVCYFYLNQKDKACDDWKKASSMGYENAAKYLDSYCK
jgi:tetratricopeptide (TPR) repeat protein